MIELKWKKISDDQWVAGPFRITIDQNGAASLITTHSMGTCNRRDLNELKKIPEKLIHKIFKHLGANNE